MTISTCGISRPLQNETYKNVIQHLYITKHIVYICDVFRMIRKTDLLATSVEIKMDLFLALNFVSAAILLFCDICPCNGTAVNPRFRNRRAVLKVLLQVPQNIMKLLPASSFKMCTRYTSCQSYYMCVNTINFC